ncbi:MAG: DNA polymerase Y family protein [Rubrivivax sp.]
MHWLALHLPRLSLEALAATLPANGADAADKTEQPLALLDGQHRIGPVNPAAAAAGVRPGLKRATALALAPTLRLGQADPARDTLALHAVAHAALAFTPMVTLEAGHHTVLLELQASLRLFGGAVRLRRRLLDALAPLAHRLQLAAAPTPLGAALLARWAAAGPAAGAGDAEALLDGPHVNELGALQARLDAAPVWLLGPGREHWEALQGMGLHRLADLRALPRAGLTRRFGATLLADLDRARGDTPDPRRPLALPPVFDQRLELFARADSTAQVLHGASALLARLVAWAQAQHGRIAGFTLLMQHEPRLRGAGLPPTTLRVELAEPAADATHLALLLRERLAWVTLAAPTLELRLRCHRLVHAPAPNGELFPSRQGEREGLARLLERLRARLGDTQVQGLRPHADHRPEHATQRLPAVGAGASCGSASALTSLTSLRSLGSPTPRLPLRRPSWLLPQPMPLAERAALPLLDGRPLQLLSGPERIEAGWWDVGLPAADRAEGGEGGEGSDRATLAARDYFIAQTEQGALVWVFRSRLPLTTVDSGWFLQGRFG